MVLLPLLMQSSGVVCRGRDGVVGATEAVVLETQGVADLMLALDAT